MRAVRDRAEAHWLPSRFRYAIFRLLALFMIRRAKPKEACGLVLVIDRDQSAVEYYLVAVWLLVTLSCYVAVLLTRITHGVIAFAAAVPIASVVIKFPLYAGGIFAIALKAIGIGREDVRRANTVLTYAGLIVISAWFAAADTWARPIAIAFLIVIGINALAAVAVWLLRNRIVDVEKRYGIAT